MLFRFTGNPLSGAVSFVFELVLVAGYYEFVVVLLFSYKL
jgi:hypothetical protein